MLKEGYAERYAQDKRRTLYPVEFVVRAFLGTYPDLQMPKGEYAGKRLLDLGFGDGRNFPLFRDLGMKIHGVELSDEINRSAQERLDHMDVEAEFKVGSNSRIPYPDGYFQFLLACHSCYYVEPGQSFADNLDEIARVIEANGYFVASLPMKDTYILKDAKPLGGHHFEITRDPYGIRNGTIFRVFENEKDIRESLGKYFHDIQIGYCDDMYWGINQKVWVVVCRRQRTKNN
jgi:ubiquinone/menaquinone biosynthesis C-methylase UbiE